MTPVTMAESGGQEKARWITTVIMSSALQSHEISESLQSQHHRVRYSDSVENGSMIFSLSGIAFLLADTQDLFKTGGELFLGRTEKFINIHRNSFLLLSAALHGPKEWDLMFRIQKSSHCPGTEAMEAARAASEGSGAWRAPAPAPHG
ncbi:protein SPO16 homolog isoform X2 [Mauremys reevesii]|uniref:protein SPO16 homolog isoform X2 n=1 Tax=Mauremys reevesii TaxID=260615 RepID=UPI00193FB8E2|nr:protein SPO16 homolog isoform X2 [Mauremys reevesii]